MQKSFKRKVVGGEETLAEMQARKKLAERGKSSEKEVEEALNGYKAKRPDFDFDRLPDSRAARGLIAAQVSDFLVFWNEESFTLEVKEVKTGMRLKKFTQLPRMLRRAMTGCNGIILVNFKERGHWVFVRLSELWPASAPSWDLSDKITFASAKEALDARLFTYF